MIQVEEVASDPSRKDCGRSELGVLLKETFSERDEILVGRAFRRGQEEKKQD